MKINLTEGQRAKMDLVFNTLEELSKDKSFMKLLNKVTDREFDVEKNVNAENEQDYMDLVNFYENLRDVAENHFNTYE